MYNRTWENYKMLTKRLGIINKKLAIFRYGGYTGQAARIATLNQVTRFRFRRLNAVNSARFCILILAAEP